ncbi:SDR family oxidoreductase [Nocardioides sp. L-11A]|uniref:SDR family oxidoreductase n=1 Tax=Nocardioides sp. L-11A TaxID=3043848 RepID=UPI00249B3F58|nr:SDR family oxidoreductase [Nocardioides sp. L-11A]
MDLDLDGRVVIVTGGSDGLGLAAARGLAAEGARVAVCGRDATRLEQAAATLAEVSDDALAVPCDVTEPTELTALVDRVVARWGRVDGLMNNAGRATAMPFEEIDDQTLLDDLTLKVFASMRLSRLVAPLLREHQGAIVNSLSIFARVPGPRSLPSAASRAAGLAITKSLAFELAPDGVRANAILVGFVDSGQWTRAAAEAGRTYDEHVRELAAAAQIPMGRFGKAEDFADLAAFLLSPRAGYLTGTAINLDGGLSPVA